MRRLAPVKRFRRGEHIQRPELVTQTRRVPRQGRALHLGGAVTFRRDPHVAFFCLGVGHELPVAGLGLGERLFRRPALRLRVSERFAALEQPRLEARFTLPQAV